MCWGDMIFFGNWEYLFKATLICLVCGLRSRRECANLLGLQSSKESISLQRPMFVCGLRDADKRGLDYLQTNKTQMFFRYFIISWEGENVIVHTHQQIYDLRFRDAFLYNSDFNLQFMNEWFYIEYIFIKLVFILF